MKDLSACCETKLLLGNEKGIKQTSCSGVIGQTQLMLMLIGTNIALLYGARQGHLDLNSQPGDEFGFKGKIFPVSS